MENKKAYHIILGKLCLQYFSIMIILIVFFVIIVDILTIYQGISWRGSVNEIHWITFFQDNMLIINIVTLLLIWSVTTFSFFLRSIFYIKEINHVMEIMSMDVNEDIELPSGIKPLEKQFNIVRKNLENQKIMLKNSEDNKREIITHLAHDLKTPLTSIIGYLTIIKTKSNLEHDIQKKYIDISLDKSNKLNSMINELFEMSSFHDYTKTLNIQKINLSVMSEQLLSEFKPLLRKGQFFIADIENDVMINTDLTIIERILDNVIKNSINYGLLNSEIQFRLKNNKSKINLKIINSCNPLTTEQVKSVFEPFYRIDKARGTYNGGTGLGLYITKNFVEKIGGKITFNYQHHKATIDIIFPLI